ncbi:MAG TPA: N-6 DNA methylase [Kineosporiaceae bacterium]|nr:N-6 DNA methylase [Kineosporiaceae bacterium]
MTTAPARSRTAESLVLAAADAVGPGLAAEPDADRRRDLLVLAALAAVEARDDGDGVRSLADGYGRLLLASPEAAGDGVRLVPIGVGERRRRGAFATPRGLAASLARRALPVPVGTVADPACGPGALLRAAFARLLALGVPTGDALLALHGVDADPVAVALCRAVLAADARQAGVDVTSADLADRIVVGDALLGPAAGLDWSAAFPTVLPADPSTVSGWGGGFDAVVLNPPWERLKVAARDWSGAPPARLREDRARAARAVREHGRHPLTGAGEVNAYLPFLETSWRLLAPSGRAAAVVPAGVVSDRSSSRLLQEWLERDVLETVRVLEPERALFDGVTGRVGVAVLALRGGTAAPAVARPRGADVAVGVADPDADAGDRAFTVDAATVALVNPNTRTLPAFVGAAEARVVEAVHRRVPVLVTRGPDGSVVDDPWQLRLLTPLHMTRDARAFRTEPGPGLVPLWEAKHAGLLDHRGGGRPQVRYWVPRELVERRFGALAERGWLAGYRNVTTSVSARTLLPCALPVVGVGNSLPLLSAPRLPLLLAALASLPVDHLARCRHAGANLNFFKLEQVPVPPPSAYDVPAPWDPATTVERWVLTRFARALGWTPELSALASELAALGVPVPDLLEPAPPQERAAAFADLDAAHAVLLGHTRADLAHVLSTFGELRARELAATGRYVTAERVLAAFDRLDGDGKWS